MNEQLLKNVILATTFAFPDSEEPKQHPGGIQIVLERHETTAITLEVTDSQPPIAALMYVFPSFPLNMDRANEKKLKKMNKQFFTPKGFSLEVFSGEGNLWDPALIYRLNGSEDIAEMKRIRDQFTMLAMFAFQGIGDLVK